MKLASAAFASMTCIALWGAACGDDAGGPPTQTTSSSAGEPSAVPSVLVGELFELRLGNQDVSPNPLPVPSDEPITLRLLNTSPAVVHSMKLWDANPLTTSDATLLGETGDIGPGAERDLTVTLEPGEYLLICEYHYAFGMNGTIEASAAESAGG
jgi:hypothetical protein